MSLYIEQKYVRLISTELEKFKKKSSNLYNFRCPFCGDSKKNKVKARGYFYQKDNRINFKCHNCNSGTTLGNFLKELNKSLYQKYILERFATGENGHSNYKKPEPANDFKETVVRTSKLDTITPPEQKIFGAVTIFNLDNDHPAKKYILKRMIPEEFHKELLYTYDFKSFTEAIVLDKYKDRIRADERIIIPFYEQNKNLVGFTGRALSGDSKQKYITVRIDDNAKIIYGLDRVDFSKQVYIVEGPFDSMFLPNCLAATSSNLLSVDAPKNNTTFVFDNERNNPSIIKGMLSAIDRGYSIFIWPAFLEGKDINELIMNGFSKEKILGIIEKNTYSDLKAKLMLMKWRNNYK